MDIDQQTERQKHNQRNIVVIETSYPSTKKDAEDRKVISFTLCLLEFSGVDLIVRVETSYRRKLGQIICL